MDSVHETDGVTPSADDHDIRRAAQLLFQQYGTLAVCRGRALAETMREKGDAAAADTWLRIAEVIATLRPPTPHRPDKG